MNSTSAVPNYRKYIATIIFIVIIILIVLVINIRLKFLPKWLDVFKMIGITKSESGLYWPSQKSLKVLNIKKDELPTNFPSRFGYSIMFDTVWYDTRVSPNVASTASSLPYRHLLHRGSDELTATGMVNKGCTNNPLSMTGDGLPKLMNPGFFADPMKNDLVVFIDTMSGSKSLRESIRIPNIPLDKPQRFCLIVYQNYVEFYKGCRLIITKTLEGTPRIVNPEIFGLTGGAALNAKIMNLRLWSEPLNVGTIVSECNTAFPDFGLTPSCGSLGINPTDLISAAEQAYKDEVKANQKASTVIINTNKC